MPSKDAYSINNLPCSLPLVKLAARMRELEPGTLLEFETDNPFFEDDIRLWCNKTGNRLCKFRQEDGSTRVVLMKSER